MQPMRLAFWNNFLGQSPNWYKLTIIMFLLLNPIVLNVAGPYITGWLLIAEFIFTLALALKCYPLQPGGLLAIEAVLLGLTDPKQVYLETLHNFQVILLLMFMVAGIYFMKDLLLFIFTKLLIKVRSKVLVSLLFSLVAAVLSAFLDALTVTAVIISVAAGFYSIYHKVSSGKSFHEGHDHGNDDSICHTTREDLEKFRAFLRSLMMHAAVGTALGGACTLVGEPQNLLIAETVGWDFKTFFVNMSPVTIPVLIAGLATCVMLEVTHLFGFGQRLPEKVRHILEDYDQYQTSHRTEKDRSALIIQALVGIILVASLAFHLAEVGVIGLMIIVLLTSFNGITEEHQIGKAFEEALPFTSLLVVFFAIVAVIHEQHLFQPVIEKVLSLPADQQPGMFFLANGILSMISDNVFVATVYIKEVAMAYENGTITRELFDKMAIAINTGTNLPSVATPNGQAAFLFLLTSQVAPVIRLSYGRMVWMALPYTVVLGGLGYFAVTHWL